MNVFIPKLTGRTRLKPETFIKKGRGLFSRDKEVTVLVHQSEIKELTTSYNGGIIDTDYQKRWENTKTEWITVEEK